MIVCVCKRVSDRKIRALTLEGVCSLEEVQACTGLGTQCGQCLPNTCEILLEQAAKTPQSSSRTPLVR